MPDAARTPLPARALLLVLAVAAVAWLALSLRNEHLQSQAIALLQQRPPQARAALDRLDRARTLNASRQPQQIALTARWYLGEREAAVADLRELLRREPDNRSGWTLLATLLSQSDPRGAAAAARRAEALNGGPDRRP